MISNLRRCRTAQQLDDGGCSNDGKRVGWIARLSGATFAAAGSSTDIGAYVLGPIAAVAPALLEDVELQLLQPILDRRSERVVAMGCR